MDQNINSMKENILFVKNKKQKKKKKIGGQ